MSYSIHVWHLPIYTVRSTITTPRDSPLAHMLTYAHRHIQIQTHTHRSVLELQCRNKQQKLPLHIHIHKCQVRPNAHAFMRRAVSRNFGNPPHSLPDLLWLWGVVVLLHLFVYEEGEDVVLETMGSDCQSFQWLGLGPQCAASPPSPELALVDDRSQGLKIVEALVPVASVTGASFGHGG